MICACAPTPLATLHTNSMPDVACKMKNVEKPVQAHQHPTSAGLCVCVQEVINCKVPPLGVPDYVVTNQLKDPLLMVHARVSELAAGLWHAPRAAMPCQLVLEDLVCWQARRHA